ncbi:Gfo/Idh/MocA family oxidoreductase [Pendulispora brunnea]|uniref:Gfo/Idh/MocA family oxidoreductase n=1 Tax=Pendulispora brunnea TaxID=2905690 RepID=A0ABZ2K7Z2_9BACT
MSNPLRIGMVGYGFMGAAHSQAWRTVHRVFDLPRGIDMAVICGRDAAQLEPAARKFGWRETERDWRTLIARKDIDVIDIVTPGDSHAEIAIAALAAGKHVLCEKPLANTVAEAEAMTAAAARAARDGVRAMCGFSYRRVPAVAHLRALVAAGRIGAVRHVRAAYLQDWIVDPEFPLVWRLQKERAGSGALGDIGAHILDMTQYVTGERITGVAGLTETFVRERPLPSASSGLSASAETKSQARGRVTVDDAAIVLGRLSGGGLCTFEATRFATGRKNALRIEVNGSLGSLAFDLERFNELEYHAGARAGTESGFTRILVTEPEHPYIAAWWPPGHIIGYEHVFTHQARDFVHAIAEGTEPSPSFAEALGVQLALDAVERSAARHAAWLDVPAV